jgi:hypothetical protein
MKMNYLVFLLVVLNPLWVYSTPFQAYEWEKDRTRVNLSAVELAMPELILKNHLQYDYTLENNQFLMYTTIHRIVLVNNNEAIQKHNRIVISMTNTIELIELKARSINKDGKVSFFDKSNLKELKDEESGNAYRIFAVEGIELGSEVEYYYVRKMQPSLFERAVIQNDVQIKHASFQLSCPNHLKFDFKSYFGFPEVKAEEKDEQNLYTAILADVPPLKKEAFSFYDANRKRIEFKLAYNTARSNARLYTWDDAAKTFYGILNVLKKEEEKALDKFIKSLGDNSSGDAVERIKNIERKIKSTIQINERSSDKSLSNIESIVKYKLASKEGATKLMLGVYARVNINCHLVVTCSRENAKFDKTFDSWNFLDDYILYFPDTKGFLSAYAIETRYPLVPAEFTAHEGLFIEPFVVGELKSALATVREIPAANYLLNKDNLEVHVSFSDDFSTTDIKMHREFSGYNASYLLPYYHLMTDEQHLTMIENIAKQMAPDPTIKKWTASPVENASEAKFVMDVEFQSAHFIEKAGPRILFKIGELIGPQMEMYSDDKRTTDIENEFNRGYDRVISVTLPQGYVLKNAQDLKFDVVYNESDKTPYLFTSEYSAEGNTLTVKIKEYYKQIYAPLNRYEDYRKVINAAADFNKVTLVLEKKK